MPGHAEVDDAAIRALLADEHGDVGRYLGRLGEEIADTARSLAPHDTGRLAGSIRVAHVHDDAGLVKVAVGATAHADPPLGSGFASGMPYALDLDNRQGYTWNRRGRGRPRTARHLHRFLTRAAEIVTGERV